MNFQTLASIIVSVELELLSSCISGASCISKLLVRLVSRGLLVS